MTIIQHPGGDYKQVALRENKVLSKKSPTVLLYQSDTAPGSSGSPVFNDQWQVRAGLCLHCYRVLKATNKQGPEDNRALHYDTWQEGTVKGHSSCMKGQARVGNLRESTFWCSRWKSSIWSLTMLPIKI